MTTQDDNLDFDLTMDEVHEIQKSTTVRTYSRGGRIVRSHTRNVAARSVGDVITARAKKKGLSPTGAYITAKNKKDKETKGKKQWAGRVDTRQNERRLSRAAKRDKMNGEEMAAFDGPKKLRVRGKDF